MAHAVRHCFERESVVAERELVRVALLYGLGQVTAEEVRAELPAHGVMTGEKDGRLMVTTEEVHRQERFLTGFAQAGRGVVDPVGVAEGLERGILDDDQWNAVTGLLASCDRVSVVDSAAGVGKSTMLGVYDQGMTLAGQNVTYLATTTPAVGVLRQDGFAAETVAKFLLSDKMQTAAAGGTVVVDESSMLGLRDAYRLFSLAKEKNLELVLLGDSRQHSSRRRRSGDAGAATVWRHHAVPHHPDQAAEKRGPPRGGRDAVRGQDAGRVRPARQEAGLGP